MNNWLEPENYRYTESLNRQQWAWEFLRRNPDYQEDYRWFIQQWQALEKDYGKAPDMDYQAWKQDPRSYKIVELDSEQDGNCAIAEDKLLIECWMGNKWGFFKFPRAPELNALEADINWRPLAPEYFIAEPETVQNSSVPPSESARMHMFYRTAIDLSRPLKQQLEHLKQHAIIAQRRLSRQGKLTPFTISGKAPLWQCCLRFLDARNKQVPPELIAQNLPLRQLNDYSIDAIHKEADFYVLHYLEILTFMEK